MAQKHSYRASLSSKICGMQDKGQKYFDTDIALVKAEKVHVRPVRCREELTWRYHQSLQYDHGTSTVFTKAIACL